MNNIAIFVVLLLLSSVVVYILPIGLISKFIIFLIIIVCFFILDYYINKKYILYLKIKEIIHLINNNEDYDYINVKINELGKNREKNIKKIIKSLIINKRNELLAQMNTDINCELNITPPIIKNHMDTYKADLKSYKEHLKNYFNSLNETNDITIIMNN